jgi:hypothetical protein
MQLTQFLTAIALFAFASASALPSAAQEEVESPQIEGKVCFPIQILPNAEVKTNREHRC